MKLISLSIILFFIVLYSCGKKEKVIVTNTYLKNSSGFDVRIQTSQGNISGVLMTTNTDVANNQTVLGHTEQGYERKIFPDFIQEDSVELIFSNSKREVHYKKDIVGKNPKAIKYDMPINIFNKANYKMETKESQTYTTTNYTYEITGANLQ